MGSKVRCPGCGAKNDGASYRCRICTAVINPEALEEARAAAEPAEQPLLADHFDADDINRQIQPARAKFSSGGGLSARIAAANGGEVPTRSSSESPSYESTPAPSTASGPAEDEPFDPDALFRDMG